MSMSVELLDSLINAIEDQTAAIEQGFDGLIDSFEELRETIENKEY